MSITPYLHYFWLRPETALWDYVSARHILPRLGRDLLEVGIGHGAMTFLMFGGRFDPSYDEFLNANPDAFRTGDVYDSYRGMAPQIAKAPDRRLVCGIDHKENLLSQARLTGIADRLILQDCNKPLRVEAKSIYSNILYWLNDPMTVLHQWAEVAKTITIVFPNSGFFKACSSYAQDSALAKLLNVNRASHIQWHMDLGPFEAEIKRRGVFEITHASTYLPPEMLRLWDVGLRPISAPLIKMANSVPLPLRTEIKLEWCATLERFAEPILEKQDKPGGFNCVTLTSPYTRR